MSPAELTAQKITTIDATLRAGRPIEDGDPTPYVLDKHDAAELADDLGRHYCQRPVIFESVSRHIVWVDEDMDTKGLNSDGCNYEYLDRGNPAFEGYINVSDPDRWHWDSEIAGELNEHGFNEFGPQNAPVVGPEWQCAECGMGHPAYATWGRVHWPKCSQYVKPERRAA